MGTFIAIGEKVIAEAEHLTAEVLSEIEKVGQEALEKVNSLIDAHKAAAAGNDTASASEAQTSTDTASHTD